MKTRKLGTDGPEVGAVGLGCMSFAGFFGATDEDTSLACLDAAVAAGMNFWDTSNIYGMGRSEKIIGRYLAEKKPDVVLATKVGIVPGPPRRFDNTRDHIRDELEGSLKRLNRDKVELYYIHRRDPDVSVEAMAETMADLISEGLIDSYGLSEVAPSTLLRAHAVHPVRAVQNEYSLWSRQPQLGLIQTCKKLGVAFVPFSPVARGMLADDPVDPSRMEESDWRRHGPRFIEPNYSYNSRAIDGFRAFCQSKGWATSATAIAWTLAQGDHLIPIPGTRSAAHLADWAKADEIVLSPEDLAEIEEILPVGFAHGDRYSDAQMAGVERYC